MRTETNMPKNDKTAPYVESFEEISKTLPGAWLADTRSNAIRQFEAEGFPTPRTEAWKYTNLNRLTRAGFNLDGISGVSGASEWSEFVIDGADTIVIVNGSYDASASKKGAVPVGVSIAPLSEAIEFKEPSLEGQLTKIAPTHGAPLVALNTAFMREGVVLKLGDDITLDRPIQVIHFVEASDTRLSVHPRTLLVAGENSSATVIETFVGSAGSVYWTNAVTEIEVGRSASILHVKRQAESLEAFHTALTQVKLDRNARYHSVSLTTGASISRNEARVSFNGEGAEALMAGGTLLRGRQHADSTTQIEHTAPHTSSNQIFRNVLDGAAHSVFQGGVMVREDAQKTDSSQSNHNILLSAGAQADTKPELQIFADDVKCAHGATVGDLDETALFYLQSRGIPARRAKALLIEAFIAEISDALSTGAVRDHVVDAVSAWMEDLG